MKIDDTTRLSDVSEILKKADDFEEMTEMKIHNRKDSSIIMEEEILGPVYLEVTGSPNKYLFKTFLISLNPIDGDDWLEARVMDKIFMILKVNLSSFIF